MWNNSKLRTFVLAERAVMATYDASKHFPEQHRVLASRIRDAAGTISINIVEGCARKAEADSRHFLQLAFRALEEVTGHVALAHRLGSLDPAVYQPLSAQLTEASHLLAGIIRTHELQGAVAQQLRQHAANR
jgi:four helix bundle protein